MHGAAAQGIPAATARAKRHARTPPPCVSRWPLSPSRLAAWPEPRRAVPLSVTGARGGLGGRGMHGAAAQGIPAATARAKRHARTPPPCVSRWPLSPPRLAAAPGGPQPGPNRSFERGARVARPDPPVIRSILFSSCLSNQIERYGCESGGRCCSAALLQSSVPRQAAGFAKFVERMHFHFSSYEIPMSNKPMSPNISTIP
jgi:hypothetical protein